MDNTIHFTKMHGAGNDYIYIDCTRQIPPQIPSLSIEMSPRHTSVGADGIILILPSEKADFKMRIFNADGSEAKMCGNGSRCVGKYVYDHALTTKTQLTLETLSGVKYLTLHPNPATGKIDSVTVDMGPASFLATEVGVVDATNVETFVDRTVTINGKGFRLTAVSMGNPHGVVFIDEELTDELINTAGPALENHPMWTDRANIEFCRITGPNAIEMRVWERGSGETMACGTGACAAAAAAMRIYGLEPPIEINLKGGKLVIDVSPQGNILMNGPAKEVYSGEYRRNDLTICSQ